jgi:hypothetical protein
MSARALIAFASTHLADGVAPDGIRLLSSASARAMRERQADWPAAVVRPGGHGLGWMLPQTRGVVEHGGDAPGVAALLRAVPERGIALAVLTNGGAARGLMIDLTDRLLGDLAGLESPAELPSPRGEFHVAEPRRYIGRYETRQIRFEVTVDNGRLWIAMYEQNEALMVAAKAGLPASSERYELRQFDGDVFLLTDDSGKSVRGAEFLGADADGAAEFLYTGSRAAARTT